MKFVIDTPADLDDVGELSGRVSGNRPRARAVDAAGDRAGAARGAGAVAAAVLRGERVHVLPAEADRVVRPGARDVT